VPASFATASAFSLVTKPGPESTSPQHDLIRPSSYLPASQRVPELMQHYDQKQRQILEDVPGNRGVIPLAALDFIHRHQKPGKMQIQINPSEAK
jgi:hypothetical protein